MDSPNIRAGARLRAMQLAILIVVGVCALLCGRIAHGQLTGSARADAAAVSGHSAAAPLALMLGGAAQRLSQSSLAELRAGNRLVPKYTTPAGESVAIDVSSSYSDHDARGQYWADFLGGLVHGPELALLTAHVVSGDDLVRLCGGPHILGCYGDDQLVMSGDSAEGYAPEEIARHEYGHHIALHRANSPFWNALNVGTKRWASYVNVCARTRAGTAFPGDESLLYRLNPGEAFAETYRLLNDVRGGETDLVWPFVDPSFYPDDGALQAVEQDVLEPWTSETTIRLRGLFRAGQRTWRARLSTPLDGTLAIRVPGRSIDVSLLDTDGRPLSATVSSSKRATTFEYQVCGQRSPLLRVTRHGAPGRFVAEVSQP